MWTKRDQIYGNELDQSEPIRSSNGRIRTHTTSFVDDNEWCAGATDVINVLTMPVPRPMIRHGEDLAAGVLYSRCQVTNVAVSTGASVAVTLAIRPQNVYFEAC